MTEDEKRYLMALKRRRAALSARDDMISFAKLMTPKQDDHENPDVSDYQAAKHHRVIAAALEKVEKGEIKRLIINCPPRHGKSELASRLFPSWFLGRNPSKSIILATYNQDFANDFGRDVRTRLQDPIYSQIFPDARIKTGAAAVDRVELEDGGKLFCVGVGGALTGRGAHILLIDDATKSREDADSATKREKLWNWYTQVAKTRLMTKDGAVVIIQTRWHEDDICGRITDRQNPSFSSMEAKRWKIIDLPALARENDVLGRKEGEALWPSRFPTEYLYELRDADPRGFQALYQGSPTPESGNFFDISKIRTYNRPTDRPSNDQLRFYAASDHAVSTKQDRDKTCLLVFGVDEHDNIWIMDDCFWQRSPSDVVVERMIDLGAKYKPLFWWAERGHISKSIGPFLNKRKMERNVHFATFELVPVQDKQQRAQSIAGRLSMGMVYFPSYAPWFMEAKDQIAKFPFGVHDDFVDALAWAGLGLALQVGAASKSKKKDGPKRGTLGWLKDNSKFHERRNRPLMGGY